MTFATVEAAKGQRDDRVASAIRFAAFAETGDQHERGMCDGAIHALRALIGNVDDPIYNGSHLATVYTRDCVYTITYETKEG